MKLGKAPVPSEESLELIAASGEVEIQEMSEICQRALHGFGMPAEQWFQSSSGKVISGTVAAIKL